MDFSEVEESVRVLGKIDLKPLEEAFGEIQTDEQMSVLNIYLNGTEKTMLYFYNMEY